MQSSHDPEGKDAIGVPCEATPLPNPSYQLGKEPLKTSGSLGQIFRLLGSLQLSRHTYLLLYVSLIMRENQ